MMSTNTLIFFALLFSYLLYKDWRRSKLAPGGSITDFFRKPNVYRLAIAMCGIKVWIQVSTDLAMIWASVSAKVLQEYTVYDWIVFLVPAVFKVTASAGITIAAFLDNSFKDAQARAQSSTPPSTPTPQT